MAYAPVEPDELHSHLMNTLHGAIAHPRINAQRKAGYAKLLAALAQEQAKMHQEAVQQRPGTPGQMGGVQQPEDSGYPAGQMVALPGVLHNLGLAASPLQTAVAGGGNLLDLLHPAHANFGGFYG